jgi:hypothetical protein
MTIQVEVDVHEESLHEGSMGVNFIFAYKKRNRDGSESSSEVSNYGYTIVD